MEILGAVVMVVGLVVGMFVLIGGIVVVSTLLRGYVLSVLWRWFMVPTLGLPALSVAQAIGIALVVGMLTHQSQHYPEDKDEKTSKKVVRITEPFLTPFAVLLIGWVVRQYM
ncbi:MAG: hypothetical protein Q8R55_00575 [Candidatus Taylorbacteria bacterium]|nr:hypothetical protein [Candidatus Taylorbacteria bacterium]